MQDVSSNITSTVVHPPRGGEVQSVNYTGASSDLYSVVEAIMSLAQYESSVGFVTGSPRLKSEFTGNSSGGVGNLPSGRVPTVIVSAGYYSSGFVGLHFEWNHFYGGSYRFSDFFGSSTRQGKVYYFAPGFPV